MVNPFVEYRVRQGRGWVVSAGKEAGEDDPLILQFDVDPSTRNLYFYLSGT